jgi:hypothetical protein
MKTYGGVELKRHHSLPEHQMEASGQLHSPAAGHCAEEEIVCPDWNRTPVVHSIA